MQNGEASMLKNSVAVLMVTLLGCGLAVAADQPRGAPAEGTSDVGNWGSAPYVAGDFAIPRPDDRTAMRKLEDKHILELRQLQDKHDGEVRALRVQQAKERDDLRRSFAH
jgi:hypothetical protein